MAATVNMDRKPINGLGGGGVCWMVGIQCHGDMVDLTSVGVTLGWSRAEIQNNQTIELRTENKPACHPCVV